MTVSSASLAQTDRRAGQALAWAEAQLQRALAIEPLAGDASFRRYFRLRDDASSWVVMDAPPDRENCAPFIDVDRRLRDAALPAPAIIAADLDAGFLLLDDLGDTLLRDALTTNNADAWFPPLLDMLGSFASSVDASGLPAYDRQQLLVELELFPHWYLERHKACRLSCEDWDIWEALCTRVINTALGQPQVFVHHDFHSCNLLVQPDDTLAVIDFQDAVRGPVTYDLASLLWDRYIHWPRSRLEGWMEAARQRLAPDTDSATWVRWCDWMGLQRNLKIVGIFARLHHRDGKAGYLPLIPMFWRYLGDVLPRYPEFAEFAELLERLKCAP
ncbi:phosphotransferase [Marinihelvus fidelis]|uniref:Phosphotransferase n=1 Tax=Marinihelvus fidelis TaxID=2613842 RepID=A0A5N0TEE0_9GAMM|nr:phosphotransferase [Marinihelvus fidelis]KAA9133402.1 phosphotransferase [Marinihelvus fidelis]